MTHTRRVDEDVPEEIQNHFYGRLFTPWATPVYGKYTDSFNYQWEGMVEDYADQNRVKMVTLAALSIASFGVTIYSIVTSNPVSGILSAAVGAGLALLTKNEGERLLDELHPYLLEGGPKYWG